MPAKVVDASVIGAWCFDEARADEALALMRDCELYAPLLLAYELTSVANKKSIVYPRKARMIREALETALSLPIHWMDTEHVGVLRLALESGLTSYDACYLHLSRALAAPLATFDHRLARAAQASGG